MGLVSELALPGWFCVRCRIFNGEAKERLTSCRCCGGGRPADLVDGDVVVGSAGRPLYRLVPLGSPDDRGERLRLLRLLSAGGFVLASEGDT